MKKQTQNQTTNKRGQLRKKSSFKHKIINLLLFLLMIIGLILVFNGPIKNWLVNQMTQSNSLANSSVNVIKDNANKDTTFDFDAVKSLDFQTVVKSKLYQDQLYVLGGIAIPDVELNLPIFKGVSNYSLIVGAGTMKPEQVMGKGNYALASHHMLEANLLFGPLTRVELGQKMYLTDLENIYEYTISYKEYVQPTRVDLIEDVPGEKLLTLVTCDESGNQRLIVQGELTSVTPNKKASNKMIDAFNLDKNTY